MSQLDMFKDFLPLTTATSCRIVRFPVRVWAQQVWRPIVVPTVAGMRCRKSDKSRAVFWKHEVVAIETRLRAGGALEDEIVAELYLFRQAVIAEMARCKPRGGRLGPGAA